MKNIIFITFIFMNCVFFVTQNPVFSQVNSDVPETGSLHAAVTVTDEENNKFTFGTVMGVVNGEMTVQEDTVDKGGDVKSVYSINTDTEFGNIDSAEHLKQGDNVILDYLEKDGKRTVITLVKQDPQEMGDVSDEHTASVNAEGQLK